MGEISAGAACDPPMRGSVDNRRTVLRNAAAQGLRDTESASPAARVNAESEDVSRDVGGFYRRARRPSFGELRGNRSGRPRAARRLRAAPDNRLDGSLGESEDNRSAADEQAGGVVPREFANRAGAGITT